MAPVASPATWADVNREARPYPSYLLGGLETGLVLFAAAYHGRNDAVHFRRAGIRTICVDVDRERLDEMKGLYPDDWGFICLDAWEFAEVAVELETTFDAVSVDTFTGDAEERSLASLELWTAIARRLVTFTVARERLGDIAVPAGWTLSAFPRAQGVYWGVLRET